MAVKEKVIGGGVYIEVSPPAGTNRLLLEDGVSYILMENSDFIATE